MDLGQLRYFSKIVEHRSFTRAAKDCCVSQPALSQQIAKLEKELGQPLFERQGRSIRLTPAGQVLQARAERILHLVDDAKRQITDDGQTGRINVSAIPTVAPYLLPNLLTSVASQFPQASFEIGEDSTESLLKSCAKGDIDVGLLALPASAKYLTIEPLFEEELLLALPADHPLCGQTRITSKDIAEERFILLDAAHCLVDSIERYCNRKKFQPIATSRIQQLSTVQHLVALGHGLSFVPKIASTDDLGGKLVFRSLSGEKPTRKIAICWNPYRYQSQLLSNFIKAMIEFAGSDYIDSIDTPLHPRENVRAGKEKREAGIPGTAKASS
jgi:LysR family hydrogen peroxide-inducible transcriptional activator